MTPDLLAWLTTAMDAAQRDAGAATPGPWFTHEYTWDGGDFEASIGTDERRDRSSDGDTNVVGHGHEGGGVVKLADARHIARHDPAAVLRRIATDRKLIAECQKVLTVDGWEYDDAPSLAEATIQLIAEGYGWTETT